MTLQSAPAVFISRIILRILWGCSPFISCIFINLSYTYILAERARGVNQLVVELLTSDCAANIIDVFKVLGIFKILVIFHESGELAVMKKIKIILASASPRRRELLHQVGIWPEIVPSHVEERITKTQPDQVVMELSAQKAEDVASGLERKKDEGIVVIGSDTVVAVDGQILGKPHDESDAIRMIELLQGRVHQVYTGVTMIFTDSGERVTFAEKTDVHVYPMNRDQIEGYVATGEPMDKAGAYGIQGYFAAYIEGISGDYNNVVGLPVGRVCQELYKRAH